MQSNKTALIQAFGKGTTDEDIIGLTVSFNYQHQLDIDNKAINSSMAAFGPQTANGDQFTTTIRYNFSDPLSTSYQGFSVIGFDKNKNETSTPQPFKAQDMVMVRPPSLPPYTKLTPPSSTTACAPPPAPSPPSS